MYDFDDAVLSSQLLSNKKNIKVTSSRIGFIGLGTIGMAMVRNLIKHGHKVSVWNKTVSKVIYLLAVGWLYNIYVHLHV